MAGTDGLAWNLFNVAGDLQADLWLNGKLSGGEELAVLLWVWRQTWGNKDIAAEDKPEAFTPFTSGRQIARIAQCSVDRAQRLTQRLRKVGILASDPASDKGGKPLRYRLAVENWHRVPKYVAPALGDVFVMPDPVDEEIEAQTDRRTGVCEDAVADDHQQVLEGMEPFFVQEARPATVGIHREVKRLRVDADIPCDVKPGWHGTELRLQIRYRGEANKRVSETTSAGACGGQKLSNGSFLKALMEGLAKRGMEVERALGMRLVGDLGQFREADYLVYAFETLDEKSEKQSKKGGKYRREWLPDWARTVAERWPQAEKARQANGASTKPGHCVNCGAPPDRRSTTGERCRQCGNSFDRKERAS
jgi:hypothetical protein